ncbi:hypothetical protein ACOMHN_040790 [Nucella lapillus]
MASLYLTSVLLLMTIGVHVTSADLCMSHGSDCRAPFGLDIAYESLFRASCHKHSICYSCGASLGLTKENCDKALLKSMHEACVPLADPAVCDFQASNVYGMQIRVVGTNFFHPFRHPAAWCVEHGIEQCLPLSDDSSSSTTTTAGGGNGMVGR